MAEPSPVVVPVVLVVPVVPVVLESVGDVMVPVVEPELPGDGIVPELPVVPVVLPVVPVVWAKAAVATSAAAEDAISNFITKLLAAGELTSPTGSEDNRLSGLPFP
jgi:hypothetical protein